MAAHTRDQLGDETWRWRGSVAEWCEKKTATPRGDVGVDIAEIRVSA